MGNTQHWLQEITQARVAVLDLAGNRSKVAKARAIHSTWRGSSVNNNTDRDVKALCAIAPAAIGPPYFHERAEVIQDGQWWARQRRSCVAMVSRRLPRTRNGTYGAPLDRQRGVRPAAAASALNASTIVDQIVELPSIFSDANSSMSVQHRSGLRSDRAIGKRVLQVSVACHRALSDRSPLIVAARFYVLLVGIFLSTKI
jgi:hypothetical protein